MATRSEALRFGSEPRIHDASIARACDLTVQPHAALLVVSSADLIVEHCSESAAAMLGRAPASALGVSLSRLEPALAAAIGASAAERTLESPHPIRVHIGAAAGIEALAVVSRLSEHAFALELEPHHPDAMGAVAAHELPGRLTRAVTALSTAQSFGVLADVVVREVRALLGHRRVQLYRFDDVDRGHVIAESRAADAESRLHRWMPASDLGTGDRTRYLDERVRFVADVQATPSPVLSWNGATVELGPMAARIALRSPAPLGRAHLQATGARAVLCAAIQHDGRLWGMVVCEHDAPLVVPFELRAAIEMLTEVVSTRVAALEHFAEAQAEVLVRYLERRLIDATEHDGDWHHAIADAPRQLLAPVGASGAALSFDRELHTIGTTPHPAQIRALLAELDHVHSPEVLATDSIGRFLPAFSSMAATGAGVLAVRLGATAGEYLVWFRAEQPQDITWQHDLRPAALVDDSRLGEAPEDSEPWQERIEATAIPWSVREVAIVRAIRSSLADVILQMRAVRVLIAESQLKAMRAALHGAADPVIVADADGDVLLMNPSFGELLHGPFRPVETLSDLAQRFDAPNEVAALFDRVRASCEPWRGELRLVRPNGGPPISVALRADPIPDAQGRLFGFVIMMNDLTTQHAATFARVRLQREIDAALRPSDQWPIERSSTLASAIWANAGVALSEISDAADVASIAPLLTEVESASRHATRLAADLARLRRPRV